MLCSYVVCYSFINNSRQEPPVMMTLTVPASGPIAFSTHAAFDSETDVREALGRGRQYRLTRSGWITPRQNVAELLTGLVEKFGTVTLDEDGLVTLVERDSVEVYARDIRSNAQHRRERMQLRRRNTTRR
jgi:hypothetical protein